MVAASSKLLVFEGLAQASNSSRYAPIFSQFDKYVEQYMREMNSPGMTLVMADRDGVQRVATYGFSDLEQKREVKPDNLFQIGSISKSFIANCLLQLHDEGKLDLRRPITEYLPWLRIDSSFSPITVHHMLTHTSGLPGIPEVFPSDPTQKHRAAYAPGEHFHYCNMAFTALGHLLWTLDGRSMAESIRKRIFEPLEMNSSEPVITLDLLDRMAKNYWPFQTDRPYPRYGRLSEAPQIVMTEGAGSIASTPENMGRYIQMIANHGRGPKKRLLSERSFELFSTPYIKAEEFGPTASYGYGIAVDMLDGHKVLRHTGGMVSFMSAMHVDIDAGVGAFASINAMQGYRPNPVAQYAIQLMRAQREAKSLPAIPARKSPTIIDNAGDYVGVFEAPDRQKLEFVAEGKQLFLLYKGQKVAIEGSGDDTFTILHPDFATFALVFGRATKKAPKSAVVEAGWGPTWFYNSKYTGPKVFEHPKQWDSFVGYYRNESSWAGSMRIVIRKGILMVDGVVPLEAGSDGEFHFRDEEFSPEWIRFGEIVNGKAMRLKLSGQDMWRRLIV
jgi:D-alanyl-D-alanine carboxypeptidase